MVDMALNGSGIRETSRVLKVNRNTVTAQIKKTPQFRPVNDLFLNQHSPGTLKVQLIKVAAWGVTPGGQAEEGHLQTKL